MLAGDDFKAFASTRSAKMSRYRRHVRARVLKHLMAEHRALAERLYPDWVAAHTDQAAPVPNGVRPLSHTPVHRVQRDAPGSALP